MVNPLKRIKSAISSFSFRGGFSQKKENVSSSDFFKIKDKKYYSKLYLMIKDDYYSFLTGEKTDKIVALKGEVIQYSDTYNKNYLIKDKKIGFPYAYMRKSTKDYMLSANLNTNYLKDVLFDHYQTRAVVLYSPAYLLVFFGFKKQSVLKITDKSKEEIDIFLNNTFQGIPYKSVELKDAIALVKKTNKKKILLLFSVAVLLLMATAYTYMEQQQEAERRPVKKKKVVRYITDPTVLSVLKTNEGIKKLYELDLKDGEFVGDINFGGGEVILYNFAPTIGSSNYNDFFKRSVRIPSKRYQFIPFKIKSFGECFKVMGKYKDAVDIKSVNMDSISFSVRKKMSVDEVNNFIRSIYLCPIEIVSGYVRYEDMKTRSVDLSIKLLREYHQRAKQYKSKGN